MLSLGQTTNAYLVSATSKLTATYSCIRRRFRAVALQRPSATRILQLALLPTTRVRNLNHVSQRHSR